MPKMLTVDERFEALVAEIGPEAKMVPLQEPDPEKPTPAEQAPAEGAPAEEGAGDR
ncbi:hypothetical protein ACOALZ_19335 [Nocardiopsis algeriensis]|uniref:hypothetical protein n=1 Tax=Nocardiopsis algeriensis TaxID=1478215 RepID=UPI003B436069